MDLVVYLARVNSEISLAAMSSAVQFNTLEKRWHHNGQEVTASESADGTVEFLLFSGSTGEPVASMQGARHDDAITEIAPCLAEFLLAGVIRPIVQRPSDSVS